MTQESLHRVVALVDAGSNPFELGCATEVFGLHRPELGRDLYDFRLCSATRTTRMRDGFFDLTGIAPLDGPPPTGSGRSVPVAFPSRTPGDRRSLRRRR